MNVPHLNVARWLTHSAVNGPGQRFVLWVQGCPLLCRGCINQHMLPFVPRHVMAVEAVVQMILSTPDIEGVTFSGGEPMAQAAALAVVAERLRQHGLSIVCYSGYQLEEIQQLADPGPGLLLKQLDVLIDGRYVETERHSLLWRGSRNQRVHFLTDRYREWELKLRDGEGEIEFTVGEEGFTASGILDAELLRRLRQALEAEPSANGGMLT